MKLSHYIQACGIGIFLAMCILIVYAKKTGLDEVNTGLFAFLVGLLLTIFGLATLEAFKYSKRK